MSGVPEKYVCGMQSSNLFVVGVPVENLAVKFERHFKHYDLFQCYTLKNESLGILYIYLNKCKSIGMSPETQF